MTGPLALAYHGVSNVPLRQDVASLFVPARSLSRHITWLRRWGYELVTFGELAQRVEEGRGAGACALTFDDGFANNLHELLPVLKATGAPATVFVVSSWLGTPHPDAPWASTLTEDEIRLLADGPVEIGSHSHAHRDLTTLTASEVTADFAFSKQSLEDMIQREVVTAAYPYGRVDEMTGKACAAAGFRAACLISGMGSWDDPMHLPREDMNSYSSTAGLYLKHRGVYERAMEHRVPRTMRSTGRRVRALTQFRRPLVTSG